jgi:hypothetical protein
MSNKNVGVIGLGAMGLGIAKTLRSNGFAVHVCDVRPGAAEEFAKDGGVACASPAEVAAGVSVVVSVVVNAAQTEAVLFGEQGAAVAMQPGSTFVMCSTVDPNRSIALEARLADLGVLYVDGPISGGAAKAASGQMTMMTSATPAAYAAAGHVLDAMAGKVYRLGDKAGAGSKVKIINQLLAACTSPPPPKPWPWACAKAWMRPPLRRHHPQRRQQLDVREPHGPCAGGRLHAAVGRGHLRQGPGPGAGHRERQQVPAAAGCHGAPDVHAGLHGRLRQGRRQRRDQDLPRHQPAARSQRGPGMKTTDLKLGCIADDFTGATDLANNLVRAGMRVVQTIGVPKARWTRTSMPSVALKSRTIAAGEAVEQSLAALRWLRAQGAADYFKYCSTFDSTQAGNIGPVTDALMDALLCRLDFTIATPAFPDNKRTVFKGYLFAGDVLLNESGMQNHPLTPMTDPNLVRVLQAQTRRKVGLIDHAVVARGQAAIRERIAQLKAEGVGMAVVDAVSNDDLLRLGPALADMPLVTAGSGVAIGLPANFGLAPTSQAAALPSPGGLQAVVSGSCSVATNAQVAHFIARGHPALALDPLRSPLMRKGAVGCRAGPGLGARTHRRRPGAGLFHGRARRRQGHPGAARRGTGRRPGRADHRRRGARPGRDRRAPAHRGRRRDLGRLRAGHGHRTTAHWRPDRSRRALVPCPRRLRRRVCTSRSSQATSAPRTSSPRPLRC